MDTWIDTWTDAQMHRQADSSIPLKTFVLQGYNMHENSLTVNQTLLFENIVGKGENAGNQHLLLFPQYYQISSFTPPLFICRCFQFGQYFLPHL